MKQKSANYNLLLGRPEAEPCLNLGEEQKRYEIPVLSEIYVDELDDESTEFVYAGDFVCWRKSRSSSEILIFDVKNKKKKQGFDLIDFTKSVHEQNINSADKDQFKEMKMDAVDPV